MPDQTLVTLRPGEYPIIHSDCGCHDRRPTWIRRVTTGGLIGSVSKKGCFPDNSACEGYGQGLSLHTSLLAHGVSSPVLSSLLTLCIFLPCLQTSILCLYSTLAWWFTQFLGWSLCFIDSLRNLLQTGVFSFLSHTSYLLNLYRMAMLALHIQTILTQLCFYSTSMRGADDSFFLDIPSQKIQFDKAIFLACWAFQVGSAPLADLHRHRMPAGFIFCMRMNESCNTRKFHSRGFLISSPLNQR